MRALIFDMDGVLVDVSGSYRQVIINTVESFVDKKVSDEELQALKNKGGFNNDWDATEQIIKSYGGKVEKQKIIDKFQEIYLGNKFNGLIKNEKWILDLGVLQRLKGKFKLAVLTGRPRKEAEYALKRFKTAKFFDLVLTMDDLKKQKPDPYGLNLSIEQLGADSAVYFGDSVDDAIMAQRAKVPFIGIIPPGFDDSLKYVLIEKGAVDVLKDINQLEGVIDEKIKNTKKN